MAEPEEFVVDGVFQARVSSKRESKAGIFLTVEIPADDYSPALAQLRAGSLLKMGWQELVDVSVQPIEDAWVAQAERHGPSETIGRTHGDVGETPTPRAKPKKRFEDYPLSAQCAMRCEDLLFAQWFYQKTRYPLSEDIATDMRRFLRVGSRAELDREPIEAGERWRNLEAEFQNWLTDEKYAGARR